jgi:hypothetical protein
MEAPLMHVLYRLNPKSTSWCLIAPMTIGRYASLEEDYINGFLGLLDDRGTHPQIGQSITFQRTAREG